MVLRPGFEPGSATREAAILNRTILPEQYTATFLSYYIANIQRQLVYVCFPCQRIQFKN